MIKVGLTGGIGSGKTTVAKMFEDKKIPVFTADIEAKKILDQSKVALEVAQTLDVKLNSEGLLNKSKLASLVFNNNKALEKLNSIIHPKVHDSFNNWLNQQSSPYVIYEAAIIFEKDRASDFDYTILVTAPKSIRIDRVMKRDNTDAESVKSRMKAQWSESKKKKMADFIIENINLGETKQQVNKLHEKFLKISDK